MSKASTTVEIKIKTGKGMRVLDAQPVGSCLAVHRSWTGGDYSLTHRKTGLLLARHSVQRDLLRFAKALNRDWFATLDRITVKGVGGSRYAKFRKGFLDLHARYL